MIQVGIIGYGYWGPNLARSFSEVTDSRITAICDLDSARLQTAQSRHPGVTLTSDFTDLLNNPAISIIAIATPVQTHYALALAALKAGKHILIEKPMTENSKQALHLIEEAEKRHLIILVDHTFLYTPEVQKIRELINSQQLGEVYFYDSMRVNLGLFRHDVNVIWDLAIHDLSILDYILPETPVAISATGAKHVRGSTENSAFITLFYNSSTIAHINVNWLSPAKLRQILIGGSRKMVLYDDLDTAEKIKVYDRGIQLFDSTDGDHQVLKGYRMGDIWSPYLPAKEALRTQIEHLINCVKNQAAPLTDGLMGLRMIKLLEMATQSMNQRGVPIEIKQEVLLV